MIASTAARRRGKLPDGQTEFGCGCIVVFRGGKANEAELWPKCEAHRDPTEGRFLLKLARAELQLVRLYQQRG